MGAIDGDGTFYTLSEEAMIGTWNNNKLIKLL
jgi:hypothetical protein